MSCQGGLPLLSRLPFLVLFAVAAWFRISSLGAIPELNGDEAYYGLQAARLATGGPYSLSTADDGNPAARPMDLFLIGPQALLHRFARPSPGLLRLPSALSGILAVLLMYRLMARALDRPTALLATVGLATLPVEIVVSRVGLEPSQIALAGVVTTYFALEGRALWLAVSFAAALLVHPTNAFLIPTLFPVYLARRLRRGEGDRPADRRVLLAAGAVAVVLAGAVALLLARHPVAKDYLARRPAMDWGRFLGGYPRFLYYLYYPVPRATLAQHRWLFWGGAAVCLALGLPRLVRAGRWERLALIGGLVLAMGGLHLIAGPNVLEPSTFRYGVVLVVPTVLALASLARAALGGPVGSALTAAGRARVAAAALVVGGASLASVHSNYFYFFTILGDESIWTFRADAKEYYRGALTCILRDRRSAEWTDGGRGRVLVVAQDYWACRPLEYLAAGRRDVEFRQLITLGDIWRQSFEDRFEAKRRLLVDQLRDGAYVVGYAGPPPAQGGGLIEETIRRSFPDGAVRRWDFPFHNASPFLTVYHLDAGPVATRAAGDRASPEARR